ncbi:hypothetical protein PENTCL1PPCAC_1467 [Pristionchus entomophagus]|uniref:PARP catalytic domain-containing protein n=1 Tax=Pristionchus entomophagus TaxID=358040 RepID=A0AAV5SAC0_9BILA|nr:hypothetical protein PENTCL1PPCAC_1467 [Pristionchus entomophagus]
MIRSLWELGDVMTVAVVIDKIHKKEYRAFERHPIVLARLGSDKPSKFTVGECLSNVVKPLVTNSYLFKDNQPLCVTGSFFSKVYEAMTERMKTLTEFCMVCGAKLYCGGLLPSICDGVLCQYQYQELGVNGGLSTPRVSPSVLALLITAFNAAVTSGRWKDILTPAPSARNKEGLIEEAKKLYEQVDRKWVFMETGAYDVHSMLSCAMPCAKEILKSAGNYKEFKTNWPNLAEFVEWLTISNQSYLEEVPSHLKVDYLQAEKQYLFVADSPAKQAEFDALKAANEGKTRYLYHGSRNENWHSIIRSGLKNMSGTKYQLVGAVHGKGIYLSPHLTFSYSYCTRFDERNISEICQNKKCCMASGQETGFVLIAVVEVVDTPEAYQCDKGSIVVIKEEKWCSIRMLASYKSYRPSEVDLDKITDEARKKIQEVAHMFKTADLFERAKHV